MAGVPQLTLITKAQYDSIIETLGLDPKLTLQVTLSPLRTEAQVIALDAGEAVIVVNEDPQNPIHRLSGYVSYD